MTGSPVSTATPPAPTSLAQPIAPAGAHSPLLTALAVRRLGLDGAPERLEAEGLLVTRAYDVAHAGPAGDPSGISASALLVAGWDAMTGALGRGSSAVGAGRELMAVLTLVSAALLWALARRTALPRAAAALALLLFATVPLAVQAHRAALAENLALPWLLAAFVLVMSPSRRIGAFVAATTCLAVAVVVSPAAALMLPALGWLLLRRAEPGTRSYVVGAASAPILLAAALVTGAGLSPRLTGGGWSTSWPFAGSRLTGTPWLVVAAFVAATAMALVTHRWRPFALAASLLILVAVVNGPLLLSSVVTLPAIGALLIAAAATTGWRRRPEHTGRAVTAAAAAAGLVVAALSVPGWARELGSLARSDSNAPLSGAVTWVSRNVPVTDSVVVDDVLWVDVVRQGRQPDRVVRLGRLRGDLAAATRSSSTIPIGWLVSTEAIRSDPVRVALLQSLTPRTTVAAVWGAGASRVEVRRVEGGAADAPRPAPTASTDPAAGPAPAAGASQQRAAAARAGQELSRNPHLTLDEPARAALVSGDVDPRLLVVLALSAAITDVGASSFTSSDGGSMLDRMDLVTVDDTPGSTGGDSVDRLRTLLEAQPEPYRPQIRQRTPYAGTDVLTISFPAAL